MNWKLKAKLQGAVSLLPSNSSYALYYWLQRRFGSLKFTNPVVRLKAGIQTWERIVKLGRDPKKRHFLEIGTGRAPIVPIAYWLMGAMRITTIDINPYVKLEIVKDALTYITEHRREIETLFGSLLVPERLEALIKFQKSAEASLNDFFKLCSVNYLAPRDAANTGLENSSVDFHTSYTVLEHIPPNVLGNILEEGNRIVSDEGLFVHMIDYSDHFSHSDSSISAINFLQYGDLEWERYAGNRYMYMNRLRHDDFINMFRSAGHKVLVEQPSLNPAVAEMLNSDSIDLDIQFRRKSKDVLAITEAWVVSQKVR